MSASFSFKNILFSCEELVLRMKKTFQTSHSSSQQRHNFFVTISTNNKVGMGEAGLPPKKPGCYLADIGDCFKFFELFRDRLTLQDTPLDNEILDVDNLFFAFRNDKNKEQFYTILSVLHSFKEPIWRAAISAIEFALFDLWARVLQKPLLECIYGECQQMKFKSFEAISMGPNQIQDATQAVKQTPFIKLKNRDNFETTAKNLKHLVENKVGQLIYIDANAAWCPQTTKKVIKFIADNNYQKIVGSLEQPYDVCPGEGWKEVFEFAKENKVQIMADETFANGDDIEVVKEISDGVNIKIQKAGGLINSIKTIYKAKEAGMSVWLGIMISSWLGCTQTFMLAPLTHYGDLDAGNIAYSPFTSGFHSDPSGIINPVKGDGLAVERIIQNTESQ